MFKETFLEVRILSVHTQTDRQTYTGENNSGNLIGNNANKKKVE